MNVEHSHDLIKVVSLLGAAVVMVPLFRRIGLGSVLGYLTAGLLIGPFGLAWFSDSHAILPIAELGVVMFLFVIGLEMRPSHLWSMRNDIFGLGSLQIAVCTAALTLVGIAFGYDLKVAFIGGAGFVLTSTAIVMQLLNERGDIALPRGQKIVSILLFEDLLIVPLLALLAFMAPQTSSVAQTSKWLEILIATGSIAGIIAAGVWLLNPLFRLLALAKAREVMTAAALLVVLGTAVIMQLTGLSMAMGAFLAGVLLAESSFRHQIEADIEPFRGLLLGLFFMGVGMSLDLYLVSANWPILISAVVTMMIVKAVCIYIVARIVKNSHSDAFDRAILMAQGGEFAFVLYSTAATYGIIDAKANAGFTAIVVLSMVLTPLIVAVIKKALPTPKVSKEGIEEANGLSGSVLVIGFGRFGQVASQLLLARDVDVTIIDSNPDRIRNASRFGFKIYFGDGTRLDVLRASGAGSARAIAICVDKKEDCSHIVELVKSEFPQALVLARSFDRIHTRDLILKNVDYQIRETFESAILFGQNTLMHLGVAEDEVLEIAKDIRRRDKERLELEIPSGTTMAVKGLLHSNMPKPAPLVAPKRQTESLSAATENAVVNSGSN